MILATLGLACTRSGERPAPAAPVTSDVSAATVVAPVGPGEAYEGWLPLWQALRGGRDGVAPPATDALAQARLCGVDGCTRNGPWLLTESAAADDDRVVRTDLAFYRDSGGLWVHAAVGGGLTGRCSWADEVTVTVGDTVHLRVRHVDSVAMYVRATPEAVVRCERGAPDCAEACFTTEVRQTERFFDLASGYELLSVTREARPPTTPGRAWLPSDFVFAEDVRVSDGKVTLRAGDRERVITVPVVNPQPTVACLGDRLSPICDVHKQPRCAADEHVRVAGCRPICAPVVPCLTTLPPELAGP